MACVACGVDISPDFAFCPQCGRQQPSPCAACGFACEPEFAFCPRCGTARNGAAAAKAPPARATPAQPEPPPAAPQRAEADRRQVTVLFADLTGFTALSERLDPEEVRSFQAALFDALGQAITGFGGFVAKYIGDAVLAIFGAPVAHEDDPERALNAALAMRERGQALDAAWAARLGQPVALHIAVHTGPVVAGSLGDAAYDVTGDTVNAAARILDAAAAGTILVSATTHALTRHRFAFDEASALTLRGKAEPMQVHALRGTLTQPESARGLAAHGLAAPMIGRAQELDQLVAAFTRMRSGHAQVVSLVGEAGTGKSRLIAEFLARVEAEGRLAGVAVRRVACTSLGEPTYGTFAALFRAGYQMAPEDSLEVAGEKLAAGLRAIGAGAEVAEVVVPVLSFLLGVDEARHRALDPEQLRRQIALAARTLVDRRLDQGPLLMIIEDAHWADAASLDLLRDIVDHVAERPLMQVFAHRPDARPPAIDRASHSIVRLAPLTADEIEALVDGLFGRIDEASLDRIHRLVAARAGGNPLFVEEIVRSLVSAGVVVRGDESWTCTGACDAVSIPPTLHGLLLSAVDRLPPDARRLLQEAAVLGVQFDEPLLSAIATENGRTATLLDQMAETDLIREEGGGDGHRRFRFTHALVHEAVYQNLLMSRRSALHEAAGRALERAVGPSPSRLVDLEALGHHWSLSADKAKGARFLVAAGDRARAVYANEDAIRHYRRALDTLAAAADGAGQVTAARERLADLQALAGERSDALAHYEAVLQDLDAAGDAAGGARLMRKIGALHWEGGDGARARACFDAGLDRLDADDSPLERAQLFQEIGRLAFRVGDNASAIAWAERALAEAARADVDPDDVERAREAALTRVQAYNTFGVALARTDRLVEAVERIEQSVALAEAHELLQAACRGYANLGVLYSTLDPRRSIETCLAGLETAKKVGDLGFQSRLYANLAVAYCALTDRCEEEGLEAAHKAIDLDRRLGLIDHLAVPLIVLGQIHQCHGDHAQAFASYQEALQLAERTGEPQLLFPCYDGLATLNLDAGNMAMAEAYLAKGQEVCARSGLEPDALLMLPFLG